MKKVFGKKHLLLTLKARNAVTALDAEAAVNRCLQKNVRSGQTAVPAIGSAVNVDLAGRWHAGWRLIGRIHPNEIVEQDGVIKKLAAAAVRPSEWRTARLPNADENGRPCGNSEENDGEIVDDKELTSAEEEHGVDPSPPSADSVHWKEEHRVIFITSVCHSLTGPEELFRVRSKPFLPQGKSFSQMNPLVIA